jgi:hypothetical protein
LLIGPALIGPEETWDGEDETRGAGAEYRIVEPVL